METKIYAAYGSNMNIGQMNMRCPEAKLIGTGTLRNYRLTFRGNGRGVANIEKKSGRNVPIVLWEITEECEKALDIYEGYPRLYVKGDVEVKNDKGEILNAMVYVMAKEYEAMPAQPTRYYLNVIWDGYLDNNIPIKILREALAENLRELEEKLKEKMKFF